MGASHKSSNIYYKDRPQKIEDCLFYGLELDDEQLQFANAIWSPDIDIVFCNARAGTGKIHHCCRCSQPPGSVRGL
mgnify:CR=1 FL=1